MQQARLFHEDILGALRTDIAACGGFKVVGAMLWAEKSADKAGELLSTCLNPVRPEKLDPEQVLFIKRLAKQRGSFATILFECDDIGLTHPQPIEPEDEKARLQKQFIESQKQLSEMLKRLERLG